MSNRRFNFWAKQDSPVAERPVVRGDTPAQVAALLSEAAGLDQEIAVLRAKKKTISLMVERLEHDAIDALPPNPLGTMKIGL